MKEVVKTFTTASRLYLKKAEEYGDSYHMQGNVLKEFFPDGIEIVDAIDHSRFSIVIIIIGKLIRYCNNFFTGGHDDSLDDIIVYCAMLKELDNA